MFSSRLGTEFSSRNGLKLWNQVRDKA